MEGYGGSMVNCFDRALLKYDAHSLGGLVKRAEACK